MATCKKDGWRSKDRLSGIKMTEGKLKISGRSIQEGHLNEVSNVLFALWRSRMGFESWMREGDVYMVTCEMGCNDTSMDELVGN